MDGRILIAESAAGIRFAQTALRDQVEFVGAENFDAAVARFDAARPDLVVVGYHFDELRPFRFIRHVRSHGRPPPIILISVLPYGLGATKEAELAAAYESLGVDEYINVFEEQRRHGAEAACARLRRAVFARLSGATRGRAG